jgi:hypothetical protein
MTGSQSEVSQKPKRDAVAIRRLHYTASGGLLKA